MILNQTDINNIVDECEREKSSSPMEIAGFAAAYAEVRSASKYSASPASGRLQRGPVEWICKLANLIDPDNQNNVIGMEQIEDLLDAVLRKSISADEFYQKFETIRPFSTGTSRLGNLLWRYFKTQEIGDEAWNDDHIFYGR